MDRRPLFVIEASEAKSMAESSGLSSVVDLLPTLLQPAESLCRPPISGFPVVAVGLGSSGRIFLGVNLEFPGLPLHQSVHAEQFLLTNLSLHSEPSLHFLAVSAAPCGHCRQFLQELRSAPDVRILVTRDPSPPTAGAASFTPLSRLLPDRFGPADLLPEEIPLLLEPIDNGLRLAGDSLPDGRKDLVSAALAAANKSYAPYSGCPSGLALMDSDGNVYSGSYVESAAFNPSFGPVQAALVAYLSDGGGDYEKIVAAVLVEKEGAAVRQEQMARLLVGLISPGCNFSVVQCVTPCKKVSSSM
ncbi:hypothetical protein SAY87_025838 [Trapa incisa]|uniref:cytidine deaminase n=1 Tax=Trapa incisa TaxID=236973 RepID=A0AAN7GIF1_9MYRT|nr:hypothetical protein SAY87_025838 [Trapa incisa]